MALITFLLLIPLSFGKALVTQHEQIKATTASLKALIAPLIQSHKPKNLPGADQQFKVEGCEHHKIDWMEVLMMKQSVALTYNFSKDCDIQGTIKPMVLRPFPVELKIRNLRNFETLKSENKITATLETRPVLMMEITSGELIGKDEKVKFTADYQVRINPLKEKDAIEENLGGVLRINEINGQKVTITEKIFIK